MILSVNAPIDPVEITGTSTWEMVSQIGMLIVMFIGILVLAYYATKFLGKTQGLHLKGTNIEVIETISIGNGRLIQLIRVGQKYIVIAITKEKIEYLAEIPADQIIEEQVMKSTTKNGFDDLLKKIMSKKDDKK